MVLKQYCAELLWGGIVMDPLEPQLGATEHRTVRCGPDSTNPDRHDDGSLRIPRSQNSATYSSDTILPLLFPMLLDICPFASFCIRECSVLRSPLYYYDNGKTHPDDLRTKSLRLKIFDESIILVLTIQVCSKINNPDNIFVKRPNDTTLNEGGFVSILLFDALSCFFFLRRRNGCVFVSEQRVQKEKRVSTFTNNLLVMKETHFVQFVQSKISSENCLNQMTM